MVGLNGRFYAIPIGVKVEVPVGVREILEHAESTIYEVDGKMGGVDTIKSSPDPRFIVKTVDPPEEKKDAQSELDNDLDANEG